MITLPVLRSSTVLGHMDPLREFDQLVNSVFGPTNGTAQVSWTPLADVTETDEAWLFEVDVPGLKRDDITVEATGNELVITGEYKEKERVGLLRRRTRRVGRFEFRTTLPAEVDVEQISADLADGVLTVRVPKREAAKPRRIAIEGR
jgi:HSP20 family protein